MNDERDRELYWRGGVLNLFLIFYNDVTDDVIMVIIPNKVMGGFDHGHDHRIFEFSKWSLSKMTILTMTTIPFYHQMVKINRSTDISTILKISTTKKFGIAKIVMIKFGLTILTIAP